MVEDFDKMLAGSLRLEDPSTNFTSNSCYSKPWIRCVRMAKKVRQKKEPAFKNIIALADYLDVSLDYLVGKTDNPEVNK